MGAKIVSLVMAYGAVAAAMIGFAKLLDAIIRDERKIQLLGLVSQRKFALALQNSNVILRIFVDSVFRFGWARRYTSLPSPLRTALYTMFFFLALLLILWLDSRYHGYRRTFLVFGAMDLSIREILALRRWRLGISTLAITFVPIALTLYVCDIICLWKSRRVLGMYDGVYLYRTAAAIFLLDLSTNFVMCYVISKLVFGITVPLIGLFSGMPWHVGMVTETAVILAEGSIPFFTISASFICLSGLIVGTYPLLIRLITYFGGISDFLYRNFAVEKNLFTAVTFVAMAIMFLPYVMFSIVFSLAF